MRKVRVRTPADAKARNNRENNETMEELDALIAERLKPENLPKWWFNDFSQKSISQRETMRKLYAQKRAKNPNYPKPKRN